MIQPPAPIRSDRITGLDFTRGIAVMGILAMNIVVFALPSPAQVTPFGWGTPSSADVISWAISFVLIDSKMRGLFSILFGASTLLVMERAEASGRDAANAHFARMAVLALFGLAHYFLIWDGDILFHYAVVGLALFFFRQCRVRTLVIWAVVLTLVQTVMMGVSFTALSAGALPDAPADLVENYRWFLQEYSPQSTMAAKEMQAFLGSYRDALHFRLGETHMPLVILSSVGLETLAQMLIGMTLYRAGMLAGTWSMARLWRWAVICMAISLPGLLLLLWWQVASGFAVMPIIFSLLAFSFPFDLIMSIGYAALLMAMAQRFASTPATARATQWIAATGRVAFTNYIGTSLVMTTIFYGYGLGFYGYFGRTTLWLFVALGCVLMLAWSKPWLDRFLYGPLEWAWRSLSRFAVQPMRRTRVETQNF